MASHSLTHPVSRRRPAVRGAWNGGLRLGWPHFWLLIVILGGMLAMVGFFFAGLSLL
jgi:hypothetical protein